MNFVLTHKILAVNNSDAEDTIWIQLFVFVLLGIFWWVYTLVKSKSNRFKGQTSDYAQDSFGPPTKSRWKLYLQRRHTARLNTVTADSATKTQHTQLDTAQPPAEPMLDFDSPEIAGHEQIEIAPAKRTDAVLESGMELLELDFLLSIVENTASQDQCDVTMRKLSFKELIRRQRQDQLDSKTLGVYAMNQDNLYGKDIQCEAMKELTKRTEEKHPSDEYNHNAEHQKIDSTSNAPLPLST